MRLTSLIISLLLTFTSSVAAKSKKDSAILLSKVKSLTLRDGHYTSHRRVDALPQLNCVGGNARGLYDVDVMRCSNSGSEYDAEDIQWTCKADLPPEFKLGSTEVICEGYDSPDDPYVLKGSCGVEYRLILTKFGEEKYRDHVNDRAWKTSNDRKTGTKNGETRDTVATAIFWIFFAAVVLVILYSVFKSQGTTRRRTNTGNRRGYGGGGGGGGGYYDDGHDDPPPPYTPRAPKAESYTSPRASSSRPQQQNQGWRPGFWTGAATGAAAGYTAGTWGNQRRDHARAGTSNWFGGTNTSPAGRYGGAGPSNIGGGFGSGSAPTPSSSRTESTGFGGTTRR